MKEYEKLSEHIHQRELILWARMSEAYPMDVVKDWMYTGATVAQRDAKKLKALQGKGSGDARLKWLHAIPNGSTLGGTKQARMMRGGRMRAEGVKRGVADLLLPCKGWVERETARGVERRSGLYMEMKKASGGVLSEEQKEFRDFVLGEGYWWVCVDGWKEGIEAVMDYLR